MVSVYDEATWNKFTIRYGVLFYFHVLKSTTWEQRTDKTGKSLLHCSSSVTLFSLLSHLLPLCFRFHIHFLSSSVPFPPTALSSFLCFRLLSTCLLQFPFSSDFHFPYFLLFFPCSHGVTTFCTYNQSL